MVAMDASSQPLAICYDINEKNRAPHRSPTVQNAAPNSLGRPRGTDTLHTTNARNPDGPLMRNDRWPRNLLHLLPALNLGGVALHYLLPFASLHFDTLAQSGLRTIYNTHGIITLR